MGKPQLIYCAGGNKRFYNISSKYGFKYGVRLPDTVYGNLDFADQDWKKPNKEVYIKCIKKYQPSMATVLDLETSNQFKEVMNWAEEISEYVNFILVIPKVSKIIKKIPKKINNKEVILAFSVPTKYGGTHVSIREFKGWNVHLLGGSPHTQFKYWYLLNKICNVVSIDGNFHQMKAVRFCEYWDMDFRWKPYNKFEENDAHYKAFEISCNNIAVFWDQIKC